MSNYTMTFYCRDCLAVSQENRLRQKQACKQVLEKMRQHELELVDFNLTENYSMYPEYLTRGRLKTLVEIKLDLDRGDLSTRDSIYNRCLNALQRDELYLSDYTDAGNEDAVPQSILIFDMKSQAQAS